MLDVVSCLPRQVRSTSSYAVIDSSSNLRILPQIQLFQEVAVKSRLLEAVLCARLPEAELLGITKHQGMPRLIHLPQGSPSFEPKPTKSQDLHNQLIEDMRANLAEASPWLP